jgi:membrane-bound serine protease (ClpP class)
MSLLFVALILCAFLGSLIIVSALSLGIRSRRQKSSSKSLELIGATGLVEESLRPEGHVIIRGELWRARSVVETNIERRQHVRVVGAADCVLNVEICS